MKRRLIFPLILGVGGLAVLLSLGTWQLQRLEWKQGILAGIDARLAAEPVAMPSEPREAEYQYLQVEVSGELAGPELHVLAVVDRGPGYRVVRALEMGDGRRILADLGTVTETDKDLARTGGSVTLRGALLWPDETDRYTPAPNLDRNIWFAREVTIMAETLETLPVLIAASEVNPDQGTMPEQVGVNIPNNHLEYVITWYSIAAVWAAMSIYLIWRIRRKSI